MATERLKYIIEADWDGRTAVARAREDVTDAGMAAQKSGLKWTEMASALSLAQQGFGVVAGAASAAYAVLNEGAQLVAAEEKFDRLAQSIGTTSDALLNDLRAATRGMQTDAELIAGATDLMSLGLVKSHDQAVRLSRVIGALDMDMNQLVLTLGNQTTMRFDSLGVAVDGFDDKLTTLKDTGMDVNAAFTEAFLQQAEAQIEIVGEAADSAAGQMVIFENAIRNVQDAAKAGFAEGMAESVQAIAGTADEVQAFSDDVRLASETLGERFIPALMFAVDTAFPGLLPALGDAVTLMADMQRESDGAAGELVETAEAADTLRGAFERMMSVSQGREGGIMGALDVGRTRDAMREYARETAAAAARSEELAEALERQGAASAEAAARLEESRQSIRNYFDAALQAEGNTVDFNQAIYDSVAAAGASASELAILGGALGLYSEEAVNAALKTALIQEAIHQMAVAALEDGELTVGEIIEIRENTQQLIDTMERMPDLVDVDVVANTEAALAALDAVANQMLILDGMVANPTVNVPDTGGTSVPKAEDTGSAVHMQHGGSFTVTGDGGIDSQLVKFWATPGEHVQVTPPGSQAHKQTPVAPVQQTINIIANTREAMAIAMAKIDLDRKRRQDAWMGVA